MNAAQFQCDRQFMAGSFGPNTRVERRRERRALFAQRAIDGCFEKYSLLSFVLGLTLVFVWSVMSLAQAYERSLAMVNDSLARSFSVVAGLGAILSALDRLNVDQQAFLSTGDERFQDGVIESAESLGVDTDMIKSLAADGKLRAAIAQLSHSIKEVIGSVGESDHLREVRGKAAAIGFFDSQQDVIAAVKSQAEQLRVEMTRRISDRIQTAGGPNELLQMLLYGSPSGSAPGHGAVFK